MAQAERQDGVFEQVWSPDHILTNATIYWVTESIGSSIRSYRNMNRYPWHPSHERSPAIEAPAGFTFLAGDRFPPGATVETREGSFQNRISRSWFNPIYVAVRARGGHFVPWDNPEAPVDGIRATFRQLR